MPKGPRTLGWYLIIFGVAASCSGRIGLPDGSVGGSPMGLAGRSATGGAGSGGERVAAGSSGAGAGSGGGSSTGGNPGSAAGEAAGGEAAGGAATLEADARLMPTAGNSVTGSVHFAERNDRVRIAITLQNCPAGPHALHLHANAACGDNGNAAGGHWSPQGEGIADIMCGADGAAQFSAQIGRGIWSIGGPAVSDLLRHAIILHAGPTQPDPGARVACGIPAKMP